MMHVNCRPSLYFYHSSSTEQKDIAIWWICTLNDDVVVYLHYNAIFYGTSSWPELLSAYSPSWYFCLGVCLPLFSANSER